MSLCTECGVDEFVEVEMASIGVGILGTLRDKTGIMQLIIKTKMCIGYNVCCSMSSFGLDSLPQDHIMNLIFCSTNCWLLMHFLVPPRYIEFKCKHWSVRFLLLQLL